MLWSIVSNRFVFGPFLVQIAVLCRSVCVCGGRRRCCGVCADAQAAPKRRSFRLKTHANERDFYGMGSSSVSVPPPVNSLPTIFKFFSAVKRSSY